MAFLGCGPMSAYDIKKAMAGTVNFFWSAAHSQVYQQARRLVRDGFIAEREDKSPRRRRILSLTPKGKQALGDWLHTPAPLFKVYDEAIAKVFFREQAGRDSVLEVLEDQQRRHSHLLALYEQMAVVLSLWDPGPDPPYQAMTLKLGVSLERAWMLWLEEAIATLRGSG